MSQTPHSPAFRVLDGAGVAYRLTHHDRVNSAEGAAVARGVPVDALAKSLVIRVSQGAYVLVLIPADRGLDYPKLRTLLGVRRLTMPSPDEAKSATGYARGTITPLGAGNWPTYIDEHLMTHDEISLGSGVAGWAIRMSPADLAKVTGAKVADLTDD